MPYWHKAVYRKCLAEEFGRKPGDSSAPTPAAPVSQVSSEGLAALEARGIRIVREG